MKWKLNGNAFWVWGWWIVSVVILIMGLWYMFKGFHEFGIYYWHQISLWNWVWIIIDLFYVAYNTHVLIRWIKYQKKYKKLKKEQNQW